MNVTNAGCPICGNDVFPHPCAGGQTNWGGWWPAVQPSVVQATVACLRCRGTGRESAKADVAGAAPEPQTADMVIASQGYVCPICGNWRPLYATTHLCGEAHPVHDRLCSSCKGSGKCQCFECLGTGYRWCKMCLLRRRARGCKAGEAG